MRKIPQTRSHVSSRDHVGQDNLCTITKRDEFIIRLTTNKRRLTMLMNPCCTNFSHFVIVLSMTSRPKIVSVTLDMGHLSKGRKYRYVTRGGYVTRRARDWNKLIFFSKDLRNRNPVSMNKQSREINKLANYEV